MVHRVMIGLLAVCIMSVIPLIVVNLVFPDPLGKACIKYKCQGCDKTWWHFSHEPGQFVVDCPECGQPELVQTIRFKGRDK